MDSVNQYLSYYMSYIKSQIVLNIVYIHSCLRLENSQHYLVWFYIKQKNGKISLMFGHSPECPARIIYAHIIYSTPFRQEISSGVKSSTRVVRAAQDGLRHVSSIATAG